MKLVPSREVYRKIFWYGDKIFCPAFSFEVAIPVFPSMRIPDLRYALNFPLRDDYLYDVVGIKYEDRIGDVPYSHPSDDDEFAPTYIIVRIENIPVDCLNRGILHLLIQKTYIGDILLGNEVNNFQTIPYYNFFRNRIRKFCDSVLFHEDDWIDFDDARGILCKKFDKGETVIPFMSFGVIIYAFEIESNVNTKLIVQRGDCYTRTIFTIDITPGKRKYPCILPSKISMGETISFMLEDKVESINIMSFSDNLYYLILCEQVSYIYIYTRSKLFVWDRCVQFEEVECRDKDMYIYDQHHIHNRDAELLYTDPSKLKYVFCDRIFPPRIDMLVLCLVYHNIPTELILSMFDVYLKI